MAMETPVCDFGWKALDFSLKGTDTKTYTLEDIRGPRGTLVLFNFLSASTASRCGLSRLRET